MVATDTQPAPERVIAALTAPTASTRLAAALHAGSYPVPAYVGPLVERAGVEPDFLVTDMLTWALIQHDRALVVEAVLPELGSAVPQARSRALHTISKLNDPDLWPAITPDLLVDPDDEVARTAWRTAAGLVPAGGEGALADLLVTQLGRGGREVLLSLSRALAVLGDSARPAVRRARASRDPAVRAHATATQRLLNDPDAKIDDTIEGAKRARALHGAPMVDPGIQE